MMDGRKETVVYIGPTIPGIATANTIYNNGLPEMLLKEIEKCRPVGSLIVPVRGLAEARKDLDRKGSVTAICYEKAAAYIKGGK